MDQDRYRRIKSLVQRALELDESERAAFLERECRNEPDLRKDINRLLVEPTESVDLDRVWQKLERELRLPEPTDATRTAPSDGPSSGARIGPYRLLEKIGEGGMGEVWVAEQIEPLRRRVALKVIKRGMDSDSIVARFEAERQALALMDHPAIAKVHDAGQTPGGRPYFVMEYIDGVPITEYCDRRSLPMRERLALFVQVCEGVQHAHQKAVIHRDLKPSNVLVAVQDGRATPRIIDFGVAKATAQRLTEKTVYTELGVLIGTPAYMSPEQARMTGQDVDTRTDVYSLGVLLYELVTGVLPFDPRELRTAGFDEVLRRIREVDPPRPSTRLESLPGDDSAVSAKNRSTAPGTLVRQLRRELDWITMRALEKDRTRRYGSPIELATDIGRFLRDEPVLAGPPSGIYRAKKYIKRHAWTVSTAVAAVIVLIGFAVTMAIQAKHIAVERDTAREARDSLESVVAFQDGMLRATDPETMGRRLMNNLAERIAASQRALGASDAQVASALASHESLVAGVNATDLALDVVDENILAAAVETLEDRFADQPLIAARLRASIGQTYQRLGRYELAEPQLTAALGIQRSELGDDHPDTLGTSYKLAILYFDQGRYEEAETRMIETFEARKRLLGPEDPRTLNAMNGLVVLYTRLKRFDQAEAYSRESIAALRRTLGNDHPRTLDSINNLAALYMNQGQYGDAEPLFEELVEAFTRAKGEDDVRVITATEYLGLAYANQGRLDEAEPLLDGALQAFKRKLGVDHPKTLRAMHNLARHYERQGRLDEAEALYLEGIEAKQRMLGPDHPNTLRTMNNLALVYERQARYEDAARLAEDALRRTRRVFGNDERMTIGSASILGFIYERQGRYELAEPLYAEVLKARRALDGNEHQETLRLMHSLGVVYRNLGRRAEAEALLQECLRIRRRLLSDDDAETLATMHQLAVLYREQGRIEDAESMLRATLEGRKRVFGDRHPRIARTLYDLAVCSAVDGDTAEAMDRLRQAVEAGFSDPARIREDTDLAALRGPELEALAERARRNTEDRDSDGDTR